MRRQLIAGNWKMNLQRMEALELTEALCAATWDEQLDVAICPPFVWLDSVSKAAAASKTAIGAQDVYFEGNGAFTGEISVAMLAEIGCKYVILGHSERRHILGESDQLINQKMKSAIAGGLISILCVGETLNEREAGQTLEVVQKQFLGSLEGLTEEEFSSVVIAYEPVWAIGTGKTATTEQAEEVHADLRKLIDQRYNAGSASACRILYGGSVKPANSQDLLAQPNIDGALVGGASLKASDFLAIVESAKSHQSTA